jgi:hypothetical protein
MGFSVPFSCNEDTSVGHRQLTKRLRVLTQIAALPTTSALRHEEIKLQVALITPLQHVKGYAAPETWAAAERARVLIQQAEALGEPPDDPLLLISSLYGGGVKNFVAFNGDLAGEFAAQFLALAEQQRTTAPVMVGHRLMGMALVFKGNLGKPECISIGQLRSTILPHIVR